MKLYPWLNNMYNQIFTAYRRGKGHHALLFNSKWDNGEDILINYIARSILCTDCHDFKFCNICYSCNLMNTGNHPDYYQLDLRSHIKSVGVDVIRSCISSIHNHTKYGKSRVIFIKYVEYLTDQAVNVLLKTIEEPPSNTFFLLKSQESMTVPNTLLSRCMQWTINPPIEELGLKWLIQKLPAVKDICAIQTALRLCHSSPIEAQVMFESDAWKNRVALCDTMYNVILDGNFLELLPCLNIYQNNNISIYWLITLLIDSLKKHHRIQEKKFIMNLDQLQLITAISNRWNICFLNYQLQQWLILFRYFREFVKINRELLLIYQLLQWQQGFLKTDLHVWSI